MTSINTHVSATAKDTSNANANARANGARSASPTSPTHTHVRSKSPPPLQSHIQLAHAFIQRWLALPTTQSHIHIRNPADLAEKLARIFADGPHHLHIVSDYDMTMTKYWINGVRGPSSHAVLERASVVSPAFKDKCKQLYTTYYPQEIDPNIPRDVKYGIMEQWWREAHQAIMDEGVMEHDLAKMVKETPMTWRDGMQDLIHLTAEMDVYFLVFSAGIKNLIKSILESSNLLLPHVHVESNEMYFDPTTGRVSHFSEPIIHTLNKAEVVLASPDLPPDSPQARHAAAIKDRNNVILMGDSLGDANMADGITHSSCVRVGFCNVNPDIWLDEFMDTFDVVVVDDVGFDWVLDLLKVLKMQALDDNAKDGDKADQH
ncbi:pyrimidine 5'-nucleotidase-domain-containing protein [Catenaria anguillulae PL171]|uniref:5'-nucleotidase n=1 Tax=Catenaria anguillulae PL171 TaxID=765915 RepID=A0A1Y2HTK9_9FUNG|nr:pyrimidine 5'-nucleotidase-domain-containing protein [Catenaria anguillulae PL171]